jgi:hypothetical protein
MFTKNTQKSTDAVCSRNTPFLETLLTLKVEKSLIWLVGTRRPTVFITEQQSILYLKTLMRTKTIRCLLKCK